MPAADLQMQDKVFDYRITLKNNRTCIRNDYKMF